MTRSRHRRELSFNAFTQSNARKLAANSANVNAELAVARDVQRLMRANRIAQRALDKPDNDPVEIPQPELTMPPKILPKLAQVASQAAVKPSVNTGSKLAKEAADFTRKSKGSEDISHRALHAATITIAIALAAVAAYFSVTGMAAIFPGSALAVMVMDAAIEGGKIAGAAWLSRKWDAMGPIRYPLCGLVVIAALINSVGVFGQLSAAHLSPHVDAISTSAVEAAGNSTKIEIQQSLIQDLNRRIGQIDAAIEEATRRGRTSNALQMVSEQRTTRADLVADRLKAEGQMIALKSEAARVQGEMRRANADVGVLEYAAALLGIDRERMIQLLIFAMVLTCDPTSLALLVATARRRGVGSISDPPF